MAAGVFGRALVASGGSILALGAATAVVSGITTSVATAVIKQRMRKTAVACNVCDGRKSIPCDICKGKRVISYQPVKRDQAFLAAQASTCACPMCNTTGAQVCSNCLGEGIVYPAARTRHREAQLRVTAPLTPLVTPTGPAPPGVSLQ